MAHIETFTLDELKAAYVASANSEALLKSVGQKARANVYKKQAAAIMALIQLREPVPEMTDDELLAELS